MMHEHLRMFYLFESGLNKIAFYVLIIGIDFSFIILYNAIYQNRCHLPNEPHDNEQREWPTGYTPHSTFTLSVHTNSIDTVSWSHFLTLGFMQYVPSIPNRDDAHRIDDGQMV